MGHRTTSTPAVHRSQHRFASTLIALAMAGLAIAPLAAQGPPCRPCAGLVTDSPEAAAASLEALGPFEEDRLPFYLAFDVDLTEEGAAPRAAATTDAVRTAGATPWVRLLFSAAPPLTEAGIALEDQLEAAAALARDAAPDTHFQVVWEPGSEAPADLAFLIKRASVAVTGAAPDARVLLGPVAADPGILGALYGEDVAAYLDGLVLGPGAARGDLPALLETLTELDPGRPVVVDGVSLPEPPVGALAEAARLGADGVAVTLFDGTGREPSVELVAPFVVFAREFAGDLSYDAASSPVDASGQPVGWSFVRGEDLALRTVVRRPAQTGDDPPEVLFPDPTLRGPEQMVPGGAEPQTIFGVSRDDRGLTVPLYDPAPVVVLRVDRGAASDFENVEDQVTVAGTREIPVEEILRRLQAFDDAQARAIDHFSAVNTTHLRFGAGAGVQSVETTLEGPFYFTQGEGFDWAWETFYVNGVRWRGESIPEIPLIQPEKAAVLPIEITFTRQYDYRLVGTEEVDGRDTWVVEFRPAVAPEEGNLYRGRVWIDRENYSRVRSRAVQLGLEGEVLSNEETLFYTPVDAGGEPVPWDRATEPGVYVLPIRLVGQQLLSVVNATTVVERETTLSEVSVNGDDFAERRMATMDSEATMVRDTDAGLRYLVKEDGVEGRVVQEGFDTGRMFAIGGLFYDDALEYPIPLLGVNYLNFDVKGTGRQFNLFFGGALLTVAAADPRVFGSKFDAGLDVFAFAVPLSDSLYRNEEEVPSEEVEVRPANVSFKLGRPLGNFVKLAAEYELDYLSYGETEDTDPAFRVPSSHFLHSAELRGTFTRSGYRLGLSGSYNLRSEWEPWGFADQTRDFEAEEDFVLWGASVAKSWYLPNFQKIGAEVDYVSGSDLDRFSKYSFGFFGGTRVHGFQSNKVRAEEAIASHFSYGFEIGQTFRIEAVADIAWATDEETGLDNEQLAGVGLVGTFLGPWETLVNIDVGVPVQGPDDGVVVYVVFLKLFEWDRFERLFE